MTTQFEIDNALMALNSYFTTRDPINRISGPQGWKEVPDERIDLPSGFEAVAFQNTANPNEIVIAFAGTGPNVFDRQTVRLATDWITNFNLARGIGDTNNRGQTTFFLNR